MSVQFGSIIKAYDNGANGKAAVQRAASQGYQVSEQDAVAATFQERSDNVNSTLNYRNFSYVKLGDGRSNLKSGYFIVDDGRNTAPISLSNGLQVLPTAEGWKNFWGQYGGFIQQDPALQQELTAKLETRKEAAAVEMQDEKVRFVYDA